MPARPLLMAGPIGYGVAQAMRRQRARAGRPRPRPPSAARSWSYFVLITALLSWLCAGALAVPAAAGAPRSVRLLELALWYAATMGWQPLLAAWLTRWERDDDTDAGVRGAPLREILLAIGLATGVVAAAALIALAAGEARGAVGDGVGGEVAGAAVAGLLVLWVQAITEEFGWRGAPLTWARDAWGPRRGLVVHGMIWGLWYAPLFLVCGAADATSARAAAGFVGTCAALGVVLGWLRLRSGSLVPPAIANVILTVGAGLPLVLSQGSVGARDAVFRWPGWLVLGAVAVGILIWRRRELRG